MASKLLGRCTCPLCDDDKAHVKIKTDKAEGSAYPYIHCRECSAQVHTKSQHQAELLLKKTRPENVPAPNTPEGESGMPAAPVEVGEPQPAVPSQPRASRFSFGRLL